jgi:lysozyme
MRMSAAGLAALAAEEQLRLQPFADRAGNATIGIGHLLHYGAVTDRDRARYRGFTRADAIALLMGDVNRHSAFVESVVRVQLNQNELDALVMLSFSIGTSAFASSSVVRRLNAGARSEAADAFLLWRFGGPELIARRRRERARFLAAVEAKDPLAGYTASERRWIREYDRLAVSGCEEQRRQALRALLTQQRKRIWRAAQLTGWERVNRSERYRSLLARTS